MSYDISMEIDTGGSEPAEVCDVGNYTYNCGPMFFEALGVSLSSMDGRIAGEVADQLSLGVKNMIDDPAKYRAMNPENGWGDYEGALEYLLGIAKACREHPKATIRVC